MSVKKYPLKKAGILGSFVAAALLLGGCADSDPSIDEPEEMQRVDDAQTPVEQQAIGVDDANAPNTVDDPDSAYADDDVAAAVTDDVAVVTADDEPDEVLDGSESEEHISTY